MNEFDAVILFYLCFKTQNTRESRVAAGFDIFTTELGSWTK